MHKWTCKKSTESSPLYCSHTKPKTNSFLPGFIKVAQISSLFLPLIHHGNLFFSDSIAIESSIQFQTYWMIFFKLKLKIHQLGRTVVHFRQKNSLLTIWNSSS